MAGFNEVTQPADDAESKQLNQPTPAFDAASLQAGRDGFPPPTGADANLQKVAFTNGGGTDKGVNVLKLDDYVKGFDGFMASNPSAEQISARLAQNNLHVQGLVDYISQKTATHEQLIRKV